MTKVIDEVVLNQIDAPNKKIALLFELTLDSGILRFASYKNNITFPTGGNTYVAKAISVDGISQSSDGIGIVSLNFDDVLSDMSAYVDAENFEGKSLVIKRIYLDAIASDSNYVEVFRGKMERPGNLGYEWITITATSEKALSRRILNTAYQRMCPWIFGGTECNTNGNADLTSLTATGTADSGTTTTLVDNALTQIDDYWNFGQINIIKGGITYKRKVKDFNATTDTIILDIGLDFAIDNTCTYTIYKGCDKTWLTCQGTYAYGPSADNKLNFGGCIHIAKKQDRGQEGSSQSTPIYGSPDNPFPPGTIAPPPGWGGYDGYTTY
jgi:hypothetical protein